MNNPINFVALVLVYFLLVYLFAIRRGGHKPLPWIVLILTQAASAYYFQTLCVYSARLPFLAQCSETVVMAVTGGVLALLNFLLILLINLLFSPRQKEAERQEFQLSPEDIPVADGGAAGPANPPSREPSPSVLDVPISFATEPAQTLGADSSLDESSIFGSIHRQIEAGQYDEAAKYLRMVAMFGKDPTAIQKAEQMLAEIQPREKVQL